MPYINVKTNTAVSKDAEIAIKSGLGQVITDIPGKTENWLMVGIEPEHILYFKGDNAPAAMVDVSIFGSASSDAYSNLTASISSLLSRELSIEPSRIYVKYSEFDKWGWNGSNF